MQCACAILSSVACPNIFPLYLKWHLFKKKFLNIKCVFWLPLQCSSETFHVLRRIEQYMIKNLIFLTDFLKIFIYQISWKSTWWEPSYFMQMDTWREMTKLIVASHSFVNASNNIVRTLLNWLCLSLVNGHQAHRFYVLTQGFCTINCRFSKVSCGIHAVIMNIFLFRFISKLGM